MFDFILKERPKEIFPASSEIMAKPLQGGIDSHEKIEGYIASTYKKAQSMASLTLRHPLPTAESEQTVEFMDSEWQKFQTKNAQRRWAHQELMRLTSSHIQAFKQISPSA